MIKEPKNIDFFTTGRQPSEQDFARISEWIRKDKQKQTTRTRVKQTESDKHLAQLGLGASGQEHKG